MDYNTNRKLRLRFHVDGNTGVARAIMDIRNQISFNLFIRTGYNRQVDDGLVSHGYAPCNPSHAVRKSLLMSECILFLYKSNLPDRLMKEYKQARKNRKAVWLIDMDIQPPDEIATIFNQSYCHSYWNNNITILGPTSSESPDIHQSTLSYFTQLYRLLNV